MCSSNAKFVKHIFLLVAVIMSYARTCRKKKATTAKKEFDERAKDSTLEKLDEAAYYYWYNRLRKLRKGKAANPEKAAAFKIEFDAFRKEAVKRKAAVKNRQLPIADFASWLVQMQDEADKLME